MNTPENQVNVTTDELQDEDYSEFGIPIPSPDQLRHLSSGFVGIAHREPRTPPTASGLIVRISLAELMIERGIINTKGPRYAHGKPNANWLMRAAGLTPVTAWSLLRHGDKVRSISVDVIAKICHALQCQPGDWIHVEYESSFQAPSVSERNKMIGGKYGAQFSE